MAVRLLVCSIGNPEPYLSTLHSAGHTILAGLRGALSYPVFTKSSTHGNGLVSAGATITLWRSAVPMNVSGPPLVSAWRRFRRDAGVGVGVRLVVLHDELEQALGCVRARPGGAAARGHNGLKSIEGALAAAGLDPDARRYTRIGIGIGRPTGRDPDVVAEYVLRRMTSLERAAIEKCVEDVQVELRRILGG